MIALKKCICKIKN